MTTATNVFRFVAVRPPRLEEAAVGHRLDDREAGRAIVDDVERRMKENRESLPTARRAVGAAILESPEYFTQHEDWQRLRPSREALADTLHRASRGDGWNDTRRRLERIVVQAFPGTDLSEWLHSTTFTELASVLWRSYFANVLADDRRPHDRPELLTWLRAVELFSVFREESLRDMHGHTESDRRDELLTAFARWLIRARAHMPVRLFRERPALDVEREQPVDPSEERITELRAAIEHAAKAQEQLEEAYRAKLARLREDMRSVEPDETIPEGAPQTAGGGLEPADRPWRLTEADVSGHAELVAALSRLGFSTDRLLVMEVSSALTKALQRDISELQDLVSHSDVLGFGQTLAVIGRTHRPLTTTRLHSQQAVSGDESRESEGELQ
jgi:hypothetical protein